MAYNNYNPYFFYPQQQQIQHGGLVSVPNIEAARNYPVAPGNSVTFKDENSPYIYTKTQGFSQLDHPVFERYRLTKEDDIPAPQVSQEYALKSDVEKLMEEIRALKEKVNDESAKHGLTVFKESTGFDAAT